MRRLPPTVLVHVKVDVIEVVIGRVQIIAGIDAQPGQFHLQSAVGVHRALGVRQVQSYYRRVVVWVVEEVAVVHQVPVAL